MLALAGCAAFGPPRSVEITEARLQELVGRGFPLERRVFDVFDLRVERPRISLDAASNRIAVGLDVSASERLTRRSYMGSLSGSAGLRFEPADGSLRLVDVTVDRFDLDGLPTQWQRRVDQIGRPAAQALLEGKTVYTLPEATAARLRSNGLRPGEVRVTPTGLSITLVPLEP